MKFDLAGPEIHISVTGLVFQPNLKFCHFRINCGAALRQA